MYEDDSPFESVISTRGGRSWAAVLPQRHVAFWLCRTVFFPKFEKVVQMHLCYTVL